MYREHLSLLCYREAVAGSVSEMGREGPGSIAGGAAVGTAETGWRREGTALSSERKTVPTGTGFVMRGGAVALH